MDVSMNAPSAALGTWGAGSVFAVSAVTSKNRLISVARSLQ